MPNYIELSPEEWAKCTSENGYKIVGSSEGGYSMDGPNGELVMWDDDAKKPYRVEPTEDERRHERYINHLESGMSAFDARELSKYENEPQPDVCPECGKDDEIRESGGMVGETILYCHRCRRILWEDTVGAVRSVL